MTALGLVASSIVVGAVWSHAPQYRATQALVLAGKTLPDDDSDAALDAQSLATQYLESTHERVLASMPQPVDAGITIAGIDASVPQAGAPQTASMSFEIFADGTSPGAARRAIEDLTEAYMDDHLRVAASLSEPAEELDAARLALEAEIASAEHVENKLHAFERHNAAALPDMQALNEQAIQESESERADLEAQIQAMEARRVDLDRALSEMQRGAGQFSPGGDVPLTSEILVAAQARWAILRGRYGTDNQEAAELGAALSDARAAADARFGELAAELKETQAEFDSLQQQLPIDHPDVVGLAHRLSALEIVVDEHRITGLSNRELANIESLAKERVGIDGEIAGLKEQLAAVQARRSEYEARAVQAPLLEQQHVALQQDLTDARQRVETERARYAALQEAARSARADRPGNLSSGDARIRRVIMTPSAVLAGLASILMTMALFLLLGVAERKHRKVAVDLIEKLQRRPPLVEIPELQGI